MSEQAAYRVLIFPAGTEIGLELNAALRTERGVELYGASGPVCHGQRVFARYKSGLPYVTDPAFETTFRQLLLDWKIDAVFPAHDDAILALATMRDRLPAKILAPNTRACTVCRSKSQTYKALGSAEYLPTVYSSPHDVTDYPVFVKPDSGEGSRGVARIDTEPSLMAALDADPSRIIVEHLPGPEFTVDCYTDVSGTLLFAGARTRERVRNGISVSSRPTELGTAVQTIAAHISDTLGMQGAWFFQLKEAADGKTLKLLEVAPRVAGTMCVHRAQGVNFAALTVHEARGNPVRILRNQDDAPFVDRALVNRFDPQPLTRLYLDLDDTLILGAKDSWSLNPLVMQLVVDCRNRSVPISLITRHFRDPRITLAQMALSEALFSEILWLEDPAVPKSTMVCSGDGHVFVDDSFRERLDVQSVTGVRVFAPDMVDRLIDVRR